MSEQDGTGLEQGGSDDASRQSKQSSPVGCCLARGSQTRRNVYQGRTNPILMKKGSGTFFVYGKSCGESTQHGKQEQVKAGYHHGGGILPLFVSKSN